MGRIPHPPPPNLTLPTYCTHCNLQLREGRITFYVEHPVLIEPPAEAPPPPPQPLKLTKRVGADVLCDASLADVQLGVGST